MSHKKPAAYRFPSGFGKKIALVLLSVLVLSAWFAFRGHDKEFKSWSDVRAMPGAICSVAAGMVPDGREIVVVGGIMKTSETSYDTLVCCYAAESGKVLWEQQEVGRRLPFYLYGPQVWVALDAQGCVFMALPIPGYQTAKLEKRSGVDGRLLWKEDFTYPGSFSRGSGWSFYNYIFPPSVDTNGNVWLLHAEGSEEKKVIHLSLLNGRTGESMAKSQVAGTGPGRVVIKELLCLEGGGAVVLYSQGNDRHVSRYAADGTQINEFPTPFASGHDKSDDFRLFVDERRQRILISDEDLPSPRTYTELEGRFVDATAYSMATGNRLWGVSMMFHGRWGLSQGRTPELVRLRPDGDLEFRYESPDLRGIINLRQWARSKGIPFPEHFPEEKIRLKRTIVSGVDGSIGEMQVVKSSESWFQVQAKESGSSTKENFDLNYRLYALGRIRCMDSRRWLPGEVDEHGTARRHCFRMIRCPSGRIVLTRDPQDSARTLEENLWQVRSPE